jgi:Rrf2 family transcriptional regulator, nitric oxide-sensitive transcriptional repressor
MQLTKFSDIGLRLLMYLAVNQRNLPPVTVAEVAGQFKVPRNHLVKVAAILSKHGYVKSLRGRTGGITLALRPDEISIGDVVRLLEGKVELIPCDELGCGLSLGCGLRSALKQSLHNFYESLNKYTLASITEGATHSQITRMQTAYIKLVG